MRRIIIAILIAGIFIAGGLNVHAQEGARAKIVKVDTTNFPTMTVLLDVYAPDGRFASGMETANLTMLENGNPLPLTSLAEEEVGAQIVVAVNPGPPMDTRDSAGISRYERAVEQLRLWAEARPLTPVDEISLISTTGPILLGASPSEWRNSLVSFQPDVRAAVPSLQSLTFALDYLEGQPGLQEGMKRSILFLSPHLPDQTAIDELTALTERASRLGVRVNVWMIDADNYFAHFSANALKSLALQTGGSYFAYSGVETLPDPESYFDSLRHVYRLSYQSQLNVGGTHQLAAQISWGELNLVSEATSFEVDIQPPNPMLLSPPSQIVRQAPEDDPYNKDQLLPLEQSFDILVEFPDGHPREIKRVALYVDEEMVAEKLAPPFDTLTWDLAEYLNDGEHSLQVEVEDSLGLTKTSVGVPVTLTVVQPPTGVLAFFGRNSRILTIGVVALAGLILIGILLIGGRRSIRTIAAKRRAEKKASHDPVSQPIPALKKADKNKWSFSLQAWKPQPRQEKALAFLTRLNGKGRSAVGAGIPLTGKKMTFGADPVKVAFVLDDPSISPRHAEIYQDDDGVFRIVDQESIAGTWVNLEAVGQSKGTPLTHGDLVYLGNLRYEFRLPKAPKRKKPHVQVEKRRK